MPVVETIRQKLKTRLTPSRLEVIDDSDRHIGHAGARAGGETHFTVEITSAAFRGMSRVARQRLVYSILEDEFRGGLHALALKTLTPEEE